VGIGAVFILVVVFLVLAALALLVGGIAWRLRSAKLHPEEDKLEGARDAQRARPEHTRVETEQGARFVGQR
jgi:hypothetical protein